MQIPLEDPPHKFVEETVQVPLRCDLFVLDFTGQHDARALKTIIAFLNPRKLVRPALPPVPGGNRY